MSTIGIAQPSATAIFEQHSHDHPYNDHTPTISIVVGTLVAAFALCAILVGLCLCSRSRTRREGQDSESAKKTSRTNSGLATCLALFLALAIACHVAALIAVFFVYVGSPWLLLAWTFTFAITLLILVLYSAVSNVGFLICFTLAALLAIGWHIFAMYCLGHELWDRLHPVEGPLGVFHPRQVGGLFNDYRRFDDYGPVDDYRVFSLPIPLDIHGPFHLNEFAVLVACSELVFGLVGCLTLILLMAVGWHRVRRGRPIQPTRDEALNGRMDGQLDGENSGRSTNEMVEQAGQTTAPANDIEAFPLPAPAYRR